LRTEKAGCPGTRLRAGLQASGATTFCRSITRWISSAARRPPRAACRLPAQHHPTLSLPPPSPRPPVPRLASVASVLQQSGSLDEMLESEEHLSDQLESLPYLCRLVGGGGRWGQDARGGGGASAEVDGVGAAGGGRIWQGALKAGPGRMGSAMGRRARALMGAVKQAAGRGRALWSGQRAAVGGGAQQGGRGLRFRTRKGGARGARRARWIGARECKEIGGRGRGTFAVVWSVAATVVPSKRPSVLPLSSHATPFPIAPGLNPPPGSSMTRAAPTSAA
jgi:hypothetical protein